MDRQKRVKTEEKPAAKAKAKAEPKAKAKAQARPVRPEPALVRHQCPSSIALPRSPSRPTSSPWTLADFLPAPYNGAGNSSSNSN